MLLRQDRASVALRRQVVLDTLREHPWSTASMLSHRILDETGGIPVIATRALWIPTWTMYSDLRQLEVGGLVERRWMSARTVLWRAVEAAA